MSNALTSELAFWIGGASAPAVTPAYTSLLAFWMGGASSPTGTPIPPAPISGGHGQGEGDARRVWIYDKPYTVRTQASYYALLRHLTDAKERQAIKDARKRHAPEPIFEVALPTVAIPDSWIDIATKNVQTIVEARTSLRLMEFIEGPPVIDPDIWDELPLEVILIALS